VAARFCGGSTEICGPDLMCAVDQGRSTLPLDQFQGFSIDY
jgi:hypothetical protein